MGLIKCPGQDARFFDPDDIKESRCPKCGKDVEFFRDDPSRKCPHCGARFKNPHLDLKGAEWCPHAGDCLDSVSKKIQETDDSS